MKNLSKYIDIVFCVVVLPVIFLMFPVERWFDKMPAYPFCLAVWLYALYFLNRLVTVPNLFKGKRKQLIAVGVIIISIIVTYFFTAFDVFQPPMRFHREVVRILPLFKPHQQAVWSLFMIVEAFSFAVGLSIQAEIQRARRLEVEAERNRAELDLYKAQIKPHFMFNTLNALYGLFLTRSSRALPSLEKFISMMRYLFTKAQQPFVSIGEEAEYIREYVALQELRLNEKTGVDLKVDFQDPGLRIPPMLLVTFVENCFKHGVSPVEDSTIEIHISESSGQLTFRTRNRVFNSGHEGEQRGIENCRKRLELSYPEKYTLKIQKEETDEVEFFEVKLIIELV